VLRSAAAQRDGDARVARAPGAVDGGQGQVEGG